MSPFCAVDLVISLFCKNKFSNNTKNKGAFTVQNPDNAV